jgi:hypothetical protein
VHSLYLIARKERDATRPGSLHSPGEADCWEPAGNVWLIDSLFIHVKSCGAVGTSPLPGSSSRTPQTMTRLGSVVTLVICLSFVSTKPSGMNLHGLNPTATVQNISQNISHA